VAFPDLPGKSVSVVHSFVKDVKLKATYTGLSAGKWNAASYVVVSQKPWRWSFDQGWQQSVVSRCEED
jgi:hypothetical protein